MEYGRIERDRVKGERELVETVYSVNLEDLWVHHPEPGCHHRQEIIRNKNGKRYWLPARGQFIPITDEESGDLLFFGECDICAGINFKRTLRLGD